MQRSSRLIILLAVTECSALIGCIPAPRPPRVVTDPDPSVKIPAIKSAVESENLNVVRQLVKDLESDDPAVRLYAIEGLRKLTGEAFGYHYYDDADERKPALARWQAWLSGWEAGSGQTQGPK
jgi:hypothetical protein